MLYCPAFNSIVTRDKPDPENRILLSRTRCKSWACPFCAKANRARWKAFLLDVLPAVSEVWSFHTITLPAWIRKRSDFTPEDKTQVSLSLIRASWDKLAKRMKRQIGAVQYFRCFELHKDGVVHIHLLLSHEVPAAELHTVNKGKKNQYIYWRWLKDTAPACGFGNITSSENLIDGTAATGYVTKYMTKEDGYYSDMLTKFRVRRFQSSQGIGAMAEWGKDESTWTQRSFVEKRDLIAQLHHDTNKKIDISHLMTGNLGEYPPVSEYEKSTEEQKRRKSLKT